MLKHLPLVLIAGVAVTTLGNAAPVQAIQLTPSPFPFWTGNWKYASQGTGLSDFGYPTSSNEDPISSKNNIGGAFSTAIAGGNTSSSEQISFYRLFSLPNFAPQFPQWQVNIFGALNQSSFYATGQTSASVLATVTLLDPRTNRSLLEVDFGQPKNSSTGQVQPITIGPDNQGTVINKLDANRIIVNPGVYEIVGLLKTTASGNGDTNGTALSDFNLYTAVTVRAVPEPTPLVGLGLASLGLAAVRRYQSRVKA